MKKIYSLFVAMLVLALSMMSCVGDANSNLKSAAEGLNKEISKIGEEGIKGKSVTYDEATKNFAIVMEVDDSQAKMIKLALGMKPQLKDEMINTLKKSLVDDDNALVDALKEVDGKLSFKYVDTSGGEIMGHEFKASEL